MALIRAFIAVELPEGLKKELAGLEMLLNKNSPPVVKWVDPKSIHVTLKFLGEISEASIDELMLAIEESAQGVPPFKLEVAGVGAFPNLSRAQVVWVGVKGELEKITQLQKRIESNTEQLGFPRESRAFTPHLTIGRVRNEASLNERTRLGKILTETKFTALTNIETASINLMKSQLTPAGAIYTSISSVKLK
jgi:RNA 2',3'-cyclic 3'-phosphodiesterase